LEEQGRRLEALQIKPGDSSLRSDPEFIEFLR